MKNLSKTIVTTFILLFSSLAIFSQNNNAFRFKITGNNYSDETIIRLLNGATQNFDGSYDAWKLFSPNPNVPSIYTQISPGQELSINSLPEFAEDTSITIYTNIPANGTYTINIEEIFALTSNYKISLTHISSNTHFRLIGDTSIVFNFNTQQNSPSFTFNISTAIASSVINETCFAMNDGEIIIDNAGNSDWDIMLVDSNNNIVINNTLNTSTSNINNLAPGNYSALISSKGIVEQVNFTITAAANLQAIFNLNQDTIYLSNGGLINLTNTSLNAQNYNWNFDDGGTSSSTNPSHTYTSTGDFDITLTASTQNCVSSISKQLTVLLSPTVITSINNISNLDLKLSNLGSGNYKITSVDYANLVMEWVSSFYDYADSTIRKNRLVETSDNSEKDFIEFLSKSLTKEEIDILIK